MKLITALVMVALGVGALGIDLDYDPHTPPFGVGFEHDLLVEGASLLDAAGSTTSVFDFNFLLGKISGYVEAESAIATDISAIGSGPFDEFKIESPFGGAFYTEGRIGPPGGLYEGKNREFTGMGHGMGAGSSVPTVWDVAIVSTGEAPGTPVEVTVKALIQGYLRANQLTHTMLDDAFASWKVYADGSTVIEGSEVIVDGPGFVEFHDDNLLTPLVFMSEVGASFTLEVLYNLEVNGNVPLSNSISEVTGSIVHVEARVVPEPATFLGVIGLLAFSLKRRRR